MRFSVWTPPVILVVGVLLSTGIRTQQAMPLRQPLAAVVPSEIDGIVGRDVKVSDAELAIAGVSEYVMRTYAAPSVSNGNLTYSVYVGYSDRQDNGRTIHSPRNCLPGAGWEVMSSGVAVLNAPNGPVTVNRYLLQKGAVRTIVLYWYQGRGRIEGNEYKVRMNLMRDAALLGRSEEALVRVMVPFQRSQDAAFALAVQVAEKTIPSLELALPQ